MIYKKRYLFYILAIVLLDCACASMPKIEKPRYTWQNYRFSVLLAPEMLNASPKLDLGLSLIQIEYPAVQADYFKELMYSAASLDDYTQQVIREERNNYRSLASAMERDGGEFSADQNWSRSERVDIVKTEARGIIAVRDLTVHTGGEHPNRIKRYYVIDMEEFKLLRIDDFFASFQEEIQIRDIVYEELRKYSKLAWGRPLSQGIYLADEPEISFNFFLTNEGLGLHWDPEQIAPYDEGEIEVVLPWQLLRPMMLFTGIELLRKFNIQLFMTTEGE